MGEVGKTGDDGEKKQQIWREVQPTVVFPFFSSPPLSLSLKQSIVASDENPRFVKIAETARRSLNCESD